MQREVTRQKPAAKAIPGYACISAVLPSGKVCMADRQSMSKQAEGRIANASGRFLPYEESRRAMLA